jgi:hypothetical protein
MFKLEVDVDAEDEEEAACNEREHYFMLSS